VHAVNQRCSVHNVDNDIVRGFIAITTPPYVVVYLSWLAHETVACDRSSVAVAVSIRQAAASVSLSVDSPPKQLATIKRPRAGAEQLLQLLTAWNRVHVASLFVTVVGRGSVQKLVLIPPDLRLACR